MKHKRIIGFILLSVRDGVLDVESAMGMLEELESEPRHALPPSQDWCPIIKVK